jgi:hypothetical protein
MLQILVEDTEKNTIIGECHCDTFLPVDLLFREMETLYWMQWVVGRTRSVQMEEENLLNTVHYKNNSCIHITYRYTCETCILSLELTTVGRRPYIYNGLIDRFATTAITSIHNQHVWPESNPLAARTRHQQRQFSSKFWADILGDCLMVLTFYPCDCINFLRTHLNALLEDMSFNSCRRLRFHDAGAPPHNSREVRQWLSERYRGCWIAREREAPVSWPPHFSPLNFVSCEVILNPGSMPVQELWRRIQVFKWNK